MRILRGTTRPRLDCGWRLVPTDRRPDYCWILLSEERKKVRRFREIYIKSGRNIHDECERLDGRLVSCVDCFDVI